MKAPITTLLILFTISFFGQTKIALQNKDFNEEFYVSEKNKIKAKDSLTYTWFKAKEVHTSQSICPGKPLNGVYISYFKNNQIRSKGEYKDGLKIGEWRYWNPSGKLDKTEIYNNGKLTELPKSSNNIINKPVVSDSTEVTKKSNFFSKLFKKGE